MRRGSWLLVTLVLWFVAGPAAANGRFPQAQRLLESPANPNVEYLSATFGLLVTGDQGQNWYYVCEEVFASAIVEGDALLELLPDGEVLSGIVNTLTASSDCACTWRVARGEPEAETIADVTRFAERSILALIRTRDGTTRFRLDRSDDGGATWRALSELPVGIGEALTIDVGGPDFSRVYVSGLSSSGAGVLLVSNDGGVEFELRPIAGTDSIHQPYIAAVNRNDPDALFIRTDTWDLNDDGLEQAGDALLYTENAGSSFQELIQKAGKLFGFALSPDASEVLVGYGDPVQAVRVTLADDLGIYRAATADFAFQKVISAPVSCLGWRGDRVDACFEENHPELDVDLTLGSIDAARLTPGALVSDFTPRLRLRDVRGPLACVREACSDDWLIGNELAPPACARLGVDCMAPLPDQTFECSDGSAGAGGAGGAASGGDAGRGGSNAGATAAGTSAGGATGGSSSGSGGMPQRAGDADGCGCRMPGQEGVPAESELAFLLVAISIGGVRRKRRRELRRLSRSESREIPSIRPL